MEKTRDFEAYYEKELVPLLEESDQIRRETRRKNFGITLKYLFFAVVVIVVAFLLNKAIYGSWNSSDSANVPLVAMIFVLVWLAFFCRRTIKKNRGSFVGHFKRNIIRKIVRFVDESLIFDAGKHISQSDYMASRLFRKTPDRYEGDDYVSGTIGKTAIEFSELHTKYVETSQDEDGNSQERWIKIFDGLFFKADFNKHFRGEYFLFSEKPKKPSRLERFINREKDYLKESIMLENPEFNRQFFVYGTDQVEARYILSSSMMQRLLDFKEKTGKKIRISFVGSSIYIAIPYKKPLFEPKYRSSIVDKQDTTDYYYDLRTMVDIVKELDLNTRIWSKQ